MPLPTLTIRGNLATQPELRFTASGTAVVNTRVACNERRRNSDGQWEDGDECFLTCTLWGRQAEDTAEHLGKGDPVLAHGKLRQRSYETRDGEKRTTFEMTAFDLAKVPRTKTSSRSDGAEPDPWAAAAPAAATADEPPF